MNSTRRDARSFVLALSMFVLLCALGPSDSMAQPDEDYVLLLSDEEGLVGEAASVTMSFTNAGDEVQGIQWGICYDDFVSIEDGDVQKGSSLTDLDTSFEVVVFHDVDRGVTAGILLDVATKTSLSAGDYDELYVLEFTLEDDGTSEVEFCGTLGSPEIPVAVVVNDVNVEPVTWDGTITIAAPPPPFCFEMEPEIMVYYNRSTGEGDFTIELSISEDPENDTYPSATTGFQMAVSHDDSYVAPELAVLGERLADLNDGQGPGFHIFNYNPENGPGFTAGVVYSFSGDQDVFFLSSTVVIELTYELMPDDLADREGSLDTTLDFEDTIGSPTLPNSIAVGIDSSDVCEVNSVVTLVPTDLNDYIRGDCNDDLRVDIGDGIRLLASLFIPESTQPTCVDSCDANADGQLDQSDSIYIWNYRFLEGPDPPSPFPGCGRQDGFDIDCSSQSSCE